MSELPICGWCHQPYGTDFNAHRRNECPDMRDLSWIRPALLERVRAEARTAALAEREALREAVRAEIGRLERAGWPHEYTYGYHKEPGCRGCEMLGRLLAALAETPEETR